ncbi:hypothetical protein A2U01_0116868, partial [Trifolium medium]|nr:hypothetical protein [Trifolium medium]
GHGSLEDHLANSRATLLSSPPASISCPSVQPRSFVKGESNSRNRYLQSLIKTGASTLGTTKLTVT